MDIAKVNFHEGKGHGGKCVAQGNAGVGKGGRVNDQAFHILTQSLLNTVDQLTLVVGLKTLKPKAKGLREGYGLGIDTFKGLRPVDIGLTLPEHIQIGAMKQP